MKFGFLETYKGSKLEDFYPAGWDLEKIQEICSHKPEEITERQDFWHEDFEPILVKTIDEWFVKVGHDVAWEIRKAKENGQKIGLILPVGPLGQYEWLIYFLKDWGVKCDHVYGFTMDDWADAEGNIPGLFRRSIEDYFYNPLGEYTVPENQREYPTKENLPTYESKIAKLQAEGGKVVLLYGVGRPFHVAFQEPHWAADYPSVEEYKKDCYRIAGKLHPISIEMNSIVTYKSNFTALPCYANTVTMGLMMRSDYIIGGVRVDYEPRHFSQQAVPAWVTLRYGADMWVPSSFLPTMPGKFYIVESLADLNINRFDLT